MTKHLFFCVTVLCMLSACRKDKFEETKFKVTSSFENNAVSLKWDPITVNGFKNIRVYRSINPIPDPALHATIDAALLIRTINESSSTGIKDSIMTFSSTGKVYY